jgi:methionyl-tRNA formyltransferase
MKLAFFGTPDFALPALDAVAAHCSAHGDELCLVVCQPDKPRGRGKKMQPPPTKSRAIALGIPVEQPPTLKQGTPSGDAFFELLTSLELDLAVVAAYGRILPGRVLRAPKQEMVNVHASLLPRWRGAAPIQRAIEAGDTETGVCLMHMVFKLDAGDVYGRASTPISDDDDAAILSARLGALGHGLLLEHLPALLRGELSRTPQPDEGVTYAEMLNKDDGALDFSRPARALFNQCRAMVPWPGSFTTMAGEPLKLFAPRMAAGSGAPGSVLDAGNDGLLIA